MKIPAHGRNVFERWKFLALVNYWHYFYEVQILTTWKFFQMSEGRLFLDPKTSILSEPELFLEFGFDGLLYLNIINVFSR